MICWCGGLGQLEWWRCIQCGMQYSKTVVEIPDGTRPEDWEEAVIVPMSEDFTSDKFQMDSYGYEFVEIDQYDMELVDVHPSMRQQ